VIQTFHLHYISAEARPQNPDQIMFKTGENNNPPLPTKGNIEENLQDEDEKCNYIEYDHNVGQSVGRYNPGNRTLTAEIRYY
jgi:hypothetical protein